MAAGPAVAEGQRDREVAGGKFEGAGCAFAGAGEGNGAEVFSGFGHVGDGDLEFRIFDARVQFGFCFYRI